MRHSWPSPSSSFRVLRSEREREREDRGWWRRQTQSSVQRPTVLSFPFSFYLLPSHLLHRPYPSSSSFLLPSSLSSSILCLSLILPTALSPSSVFHPSPSTFHPPFPFPLSLLQSFSFLSISSHQAYTLSYLPSELPLLTNPVFCSVHIHANTLSNTRLWISLFLSTSGLPTLTYTQEADTHSLFRPSA
ncbi:hypothetical protein IE53DRAFT_244278 [Violaceomyces palustris]|uniref:Uncharacterized protein n=1 Tax=Violaceomyces palustris TaxID=1673888 RepID=A0ACD0NP06_9BASI|nr:hypothetical protein IE53DRAFT_244278 [Violaceomyces palustris]